MYTTTVPKLKKQKTHVKRTFLKQIYFILLGNILLLMNSFCLTKFAENKTHRVEKNQKFP